MAVTEVMDRRLRRKMLSWRAEVIGEGVKLVGGGALPYSPPSHAACRGVPHLTDHTSPLTGCEGFTVLNMCCLADAIHEAKTVAEHVPLRGVPASAGNRSMRAGVACCVSGASGGAPPLPASGVR